MRPRVVVAGVNGCTFFAKALALARGLAGHDLSVHDFETFDEFRQFIARPGSAAPAAPRAWTTSPAIWCSDVHRPGLQFLGGYDALVAAVGVE